MRQIGPPGNLVSRLLTPGRALGVALSVGVLLGCRGAAEPTSAPAPVAPAARAVPLMPTWVPLTAPGAEIDGVGRPDGYRETFNRFFENDRLANRDVHVAYINVVGAQAREGQPFPYDTIIVLEIYPAMPTANGDIARAADGRFLHGDLATVFVMRKEPGFGAKYGPSRTGEWEYGDYRPDGTLALVPEMTHVCAQCHLEQSNAQQDWLIGANRFFAQRSSAAPGVAPTPPTPLGAALLTRLVPLALIASAPFLALAVIARRSFRSRR